MSNQDQNAKESVIDVQPDAEKSPDSNTMSKILHNALEHFSRYGYAGASVREITQASQVTKPTLYYYFKNKEELYKKLSQTCFDEILTDIKKSSQVSGNLHDKILSMFREYTRLCQERFNVVRFVHLMSVSSERSAPDVGVLIFAQDLVDCVKGVVKNAVNQGEITAENEQAITFTILGMLNLRVTSLLMGYQPKFSEADVDRAIHLATSKKS